MEYLEIVIKGILCGILSAYLIIYGLRPAIPYPDFLLDFFENPWLFLILLIVNYYIFVWDHTICVLLMLSIAALIFDYIVFTNKGFKKVVVTTTPRSFVEDFTLSQAPPSIDPVVPEALFKTFFDVLIDDIKVYDTDVYSGQPAPWHP